MKINNDKSTYKPPFSIVLVDAMDAYYYADVMGKMEEVGKEEDLGKAIAIADALFVLKNKGWESLRAMNDVDGGYDVRVYDSTMSCVYAAHTKYIENWIGETSSELQPVDHEKTGKVTYDNPDDAKAFGDALAKAMVEGLNRHVREEEESMKKKKKADARNS